MAEGRPNQNRGQRPNRQASDPLTELFLGESETYVAPYAPKTVSSLKNAPHLIKKENRGSYGIASERIEARPDSIKLVARKEAEPIKYGEQTPGELDTKESLAERPLTVEDKGNTRHIHGRVALETKPVLIINNVAVAFRGPGGRPVEDSQPLQKMPNESFAMNVAEEFFLIGRDKKSGEKVILVPDTGDHHLNEDLARSAKSRIQEAIKAELESIVSGKGDASMLDILNDRAKELAHVYKIRTIKGQEAGYDFNEYAQNVETVIEGGTVESQKTKGLIRFDEEHRTFSITRPVILDLDDYDVEVLDATGANRQVITIDGPHPSQSPDVNIIMRALQGEQLVQTEKQGEVKLPKPLPVSTIRNPYAVFPSFSA